MSDVQATQSAESLERRDTIVALQLRMAKATVYGAKLLKDYSDQPGHRGVSGDEYGFPEDMVIRAIQQGFQVGVHAIGDAGNTYSKGGHRVRLTLTDLTSATRIRYEY